MDDRAKLHYRKHWKFKQILQHKEDKKHGSDLKIRLTPKGEFDRKELIEHSQKLLIRSMELQARSLFIQQQKLLKMNSIEADVM